MYENKLKNKSEWFDRFSIKTKQVENIKNLIDSSLEKDEIILFCDLAPFKKRWKRRDCNHKRLYINKKLYWWKEK